MAEPTRDDVDALVGPATPHFAYQLRARVLELPFAETRLDQLEVDEARDAPAAPERQREPKLDRDQREQQPPAREHRDGREDPDDRLVEARRAGVDHL